MAVVFMEGFDHISGAQVAPKGWTGGFIDAQAGRFGGQCMRHQGSSAAHSLPSSYSTAIIGVAVLPNVNNLNDNMVGFRNGSTIVAAVRAVTVGPINVWRVVNSAGTTLATGTTSIVLGQWVYIELKVTVSATVGTVEVRLNGASTAECSATNVNTGASNIDTILISALNAQTFYDDIYICDTSGSAPTNDFLGDCRIETLRGTAEGANTAWTANTGTKVSRVNDTSSYDSDTGYIYSSTPGDRETFTNGSLATTTGTVYAVQTNVVARKDGAAARTIAPVIRKSGVNYDGTTTAALGASYVDYMQLYDRQDPAGVDWSIATVNAMEVGVKEVA